MCNVWILQNMYFTVQSSHQVHSGSVLNYLISLHSKEMKGRFRYIVAQNWSQQKQSLNLSKYYFLESLFILWRYIQFIRLAVQYYCLRASSSVLQHSIIYFVGQYSNIIWSHSPSVFAEKYYYWKEQSTSITAVDEAVGWVLQDWIKAPAPRPNLQNVFLWRTK